MSLTNLGVLAGKQGDYPVARAFLEESVQRYRELNDREGIAYALLNLGSVAEDEDDYPGARALHGESLAIAREVGNRRCIASALEGLANAISKTIGPTQAARTWGAAERLRENVGAPLAPSERTRYDQQVADARNKLGDDAQFALAWNDGRAMSLEQAIEYALKPSHESSVALDRTAR
jgi:tetratricopeptide (TPR) repeat protein